MPLILAIEPDRRQASQLMSIARQLSAELVLAESAERALSALRDRVPDLILTPALLSRTDDAAFTDRLRELGGTAAHVQTLTIPILSTSQTPPRRGRMLSALRRAKPKTATPDGCSPDVFADQIAVYLERAVEAREAHPHIQAPPTRGDTLAIPVIEFVAASVETPRPAVATAWEPLEPRGAIGEPSPLVATPPPEPALQPPPLPVVESPHPPTAAMPDTLAEVPAVEPSPAVFQEPETVFEQPAAVVAESASLSAALRDVDDTLDVVVSSLDDAPVVMPAVEPPPVVFEEPGLLALVEPAPPFDEAPVVVENEPVAEDLDSSDLAWPVAAERELPDVAPAVIETLTVALEPVPSALLTQRFEGVLPTPIEEMPACVPEEIPVMAAGLLPPIPAPVVETLALEETPTVLADASPGLAARLRDVLLVWRRERIPTSTPDVGEPADAHEPVLPAPFPELAASADEIPGLVPEEAPVIAAQLPLSSEAILSENVEPSIARPSEQTTAVLADETRGLAASLRDALSVLLRQKTAQPEAAITLAPEPALIVPIEELPQSGLATESVDEDETWVGVSLDEFCDAPAASTPAHDVPLDDDMWVLTPIPDMDEPLVEVREVLQILQVREVHKVQEVPRNPEPAPQPSPRRNGSRPKKPKPVQDEWGFFDPDQCGFAALLDKLDEITEDEEATEKREDSTVRLIAY